MQVKENIKESDRCNCGRSPTGECIGCYFLTGAEFETRLAEQQDNNHEAGTWPAKHIQNSSFFATHQLSFKTTPDVHDKPVAR
jgi:hypothetical protein